jgi:hypothetical protein
MIVERSITNNTRTLKRFALMPTRLSNKSWIWFEFYNEDQKKSVMVDNIVHHGIFTDTHSIDPIVTEHWVCVTKYQ